MLMALSLICFVTWGSHLVEYLCEPLRKCLKDEDPYVRKTAAVCVAKLHDINASLVEDQGFLDLLRDLLSDSNPMVSTVVLMHCSVNTYFYSESDRNQSQEESSPAWTQQTYRPPRSKYMLCCSGWSALPPVPTLDGGNPMLTWVGGATPPPRQEGWGYPPPKPVSQMVVPPPPCEMWQTDTCECGWL